MPAFRIIWSTRWLYEIIIRNALSINPAVNLVQNVGFREDATSGKHDSFRLYSYFEPEEMAEIVHPFFVLPDKKADNIFFEIIKEADPRLISKNNMNIVNSLKKIVPQKAKKLMKSLFRSI